MSEPIEQTIEVTHAEELLTLRRVNGELLTKSATRKARIAELEATVTGLQGKLTEASSTINDLSIVRPLKAMASAMSTAPDLWLEQFSKAHRVEMVNGQLVLMTADGKPVLKGDKAIPFERDALAAHLTDEAHPQGNVFRAIVIANRASGASGGQAKPRTKQATTKSSTGPRFGLR